jgi:hypothetical protein
VVVDICDRRPRVCSSSLSSPLCPLLKKGRGTHGAAVVRAPAKKASEIPISLGWPAVEVPHIPAQNGVLYILPHPWFGDLSRFILIELPDSNYQRREYYVKLLHQGCLLSECGGGKIPSWSAELRQVTPPGLMMFPACRYVRMNLSGNSD